MNGMKLMSYAVLSTLLYAATTAFAATPFAVKFPDAGARYDIIVSKDGSGSFTTIQAAIYSVRDFSQNPVLIYVKNGIYHEKVVVPSWKTNVWIIGESKDSTVITYNDYHGKDTINTFTSYTFLVRGNGFHAENVTFENSAGPVGQAVALDVEADRCVFANCKIIGDQDTLFAGIDSSREYYNHCYIEGTTDFIFGAATAVFDDCLIKSKKNSYVTAASTTDRQKFGFVFRNCRLVADSGITELYLGRPWRPYAAVAFLHCYLGRQIVPAGWFNWDKPVREKTARYSEYMSTGPGADPGARVKWSRQLTATEVKGYTLKAIFAGNGGWIPREK